MGDHLEPIIAISMEAIPSAGDRAIVLSILTMLDRILAPSNLRFYSSSDIFASIIFCSTTMGHEVEH